LPAAAHALERAGLAAVSWPKQRRLTRLAQHYLQWRWLEGARGALDIRHVRSAFDAAGA